jgi:hypothetical protein
MEGIANNTRQSKVTYFANYQWLGKHGHRKQNQGKLHDELIEQLPIKMGELLQKAFHSSWLTC